MNAITIRQATTRDAKYIQDVLISSQWHTYQTLYTNDYIEALIAQYYNLQRIEQEIKSIDETWHGYIVAELNREIIGVIGGGIKDDTSAEVYVFYLKPTMIGKGVGTKLLNFFTKIQKYSYGAEEQWVAVAKGNRDAILFYEARGFSFQQEIQSYGSSTEENDFSLTYKRMI